jgi:hypothetical protein
MENALMSYQFDQAPVRVVMVLDDPWFVANDVAAVLGYKSFHMTRMLDDDEKGIHVVDTLGGRQELSIISESGLYSAVFKSRRPEAQRFRKWVTGEVLPTIRRTGKYHLHDEEMPPQELGSDIDARDLGAKVGAIRMCLRLYGPDAARNLWLDLGLPLRIADARANYRDAIAGPIKDWLAEHEPATTAEITGGIGLDPTSANDRRRVAAVLRVLGWWSKRTRRGADLVWAWYPAEAARGED